MSDSPKPPYVQFEVRAVEDRTKTLEGGHYAARDVIFAIVTPAGTRDRIEKPAEDWIAGIEEGVRQERIPENWLHAYRDALKRFETSQENPEFGTSVKDWAGVSPAQVKALLAANLRTVEEVAEATEEAIMRLGMGGRALKHKAQAWLDASKDTGKVAGELEKLRQENAELLSRDKEREQKLQDMQKQLDALTNAIDSREKVPAEED